MNYDIYKVARERHCANKNLLPCDFAYPNGYFEYITFDDEEFDKNGFISSITFLTSNEVAAFLRTVEKASSRSLIPFGKDDDLLFCFDGLGSEAIYAIDLGCQPLQARCTAKTFKEFINRIRIEGGLPLWHERA